jgi:hypothetical protein
VSNDVLDLREAVSLVGSVQFLSAPAEYEAR